MIRLCAFADESDKMVEGQIKALKRNGIDLIELRGLDGTNIAKITEDEARAYAKQFEDAGIKVWSIGSPLGKVRITADLEEHMAEVRHVCRLAKIFGTDKIRMFSFRHAYESREQVMSTLREMLAIAKQEGVQLYHENEKEIYGDTLERVLDIMNEIDGLKYIYDPANYLEVGEKADDTLDALHAKTDYFHIKDVIAESGTLVPAGCGDGKIDELIARISPEDDKVMTLEPHLKIFDGFAEIDGTEMKNKYHFESNEAAFDAAVNALKGLLSDAGYKYDAEKRGYVK